MAIEDNSITVPYKLNGKFINSKRWLLLSDGSKDCLNALSRLPCGEQQKIFYLITKTKTSMKKLLLSIFLIAAISLFVPYGVQGQNRKTKAVSKITVSSLNGCWKRIGVITDGKPEADPLGQLRMFSGGFYTIIGQDTARNWTRTFAGIYEIDNNLFKETTQYSSLSSMAGNIHWQEMKITGDTLSLKFFKKITDSTGKQLPMPSYTREVVLVKMKR